MTCPKCGNAEDRNPHHLATGGGVSKRWCPGYHPPIETPGVMGTCVRNSKCTVVHTGDKPDPKLTTEHLDITCNTCGYCWAQPCADAKEGE